MDLLYRKYGAYYNEKIISEILDNNTPLFTFEAEGMEGVVDPIEISFSQYNYQRNKGNVCDDRNPEDYQILNKKLNEGKWLRVGENPVVTSGKSVYSNKTFLNLILKDKTDDSVLSFAVADWLLHDIRDVYYRYIDDIICAFDRYSYISRSEYYQELFRQRIEDVKRI